MTHRRFIFCILLVTCFFTAASAQEGAVLEPVRIFLESQLAEQKIPGLSIAVVVGDQLVYSEGFGFADLESGARATGSTVYRIGSVSKPIVATGMMQLWEQGKVDLEADIRRYVPEWPEKTWIVRVRHLLSHTSGIRHYNGDEFLSTRRYTDLAGPMEIFKTDPLLFEPGTKSSYSTYGFNLVANIVEKAAGMPVEEYMRKHVYQPAWMNSTGLEDWGAIQHGRARWYGTDNRGKWVNEPYVDLSNKYAGGGLTSTVEDLARLHIAYARGTILKPETIKKMYTPLTLNDGAPTEYGVAWRVQEVKLSDGRTVREVSHGGGSVGANTLFVRYPDEGFAIAVIVNHRANLGKIVQGVFDLFLKSGAVQR